MFLQNELNRQIINVGKAQESLAEALIVKLVTREITLDFIRLNYSELFEKNPQVIEMIFDKIEHFQFNEVMTESKYLIPQAIALEMKDRFTTNSKEVAAELKTIIENNHTLRLEKILDLLKLPQQEKLIDNYIEKFENRMNNISNELKKIKSIENE